MISAILGAVCLLQEPVIRYAPTDGDEYKFSLTYIYADEESASDEKLTFTGTKKVSVKDANSFVVTVSQHLSAHHLAGDELPIPDGVPFDSQERWNSRGFFTPAQQIRDVAQFRLDRARWMPLPEKPLDGTLKWSTTAPMVIDDRIPAMTFQCSAKPSQLARHFEVDVKAKENSDRGLEVTGKLRFSLEKSRIVNGTWKLIGAPRPGNPQARTECTIDYRELAK